MTSPSFTIIEEGEEDGYSGTSASTLAAAAVIMLLDDYIIFEGKPHLVFLNPLLYSQSYKGSFSFDPLKTTRTQYRLILSRLDEYPMGFKRGLPWVCDTRRLGSCNWQVFLICQCEFDH
jgi:hypothetical protein